MQIEHERGYLIIAQDNPTTDYLACARLLARSLRQHDAKNKICLLTDQVPDNVDDFDIVRTFPFGDQSGDNEWKLHNDWQCFYASPFRQTIKIEADMVVPQSIAHWFDILQIRDIALTTGARDFRGQRSRSRYYRKIFDENQLPDVYNAITYWRLSKPAQDFFNLVKEIFSNWNEVVEILKFGRDQPLNTDLAYAIAAVIIGPEECLLPLDVPSMIHMKTHINDLVSEDWTKELIWEISPGSLRINTLEQQWPFHYHVKSWAQKVSDEY